MSNKSDSIAFSFNKMKRSHTLARDTLSPSQLFSATFYGIQGFDDLRQLLKKGADVSKEIAAVIAERAALELQYSKGLHKIGAKLSKACTNADSTCAAAWETVAEELTAEAEAHKKIGESLMEDVCKPLRNMCDNHTKVKKPIELAVDKATKTLIQARSKELAYKVKSFQSNAEAEKLHNSIIEKRTSSKKTPEKDLQKLDKKLQTLKEHIRKSTKKYYLYAIKAERSRQTWEKTSLKSMSHLQQLEEERLKELHKYLKLYKYSLEHAIPQLTSTCERVNDAASCIDFDRDLRKVMDIRSKSESLPEQILLESYAEDLNRVMDKERRRQALTLYLYYLNQDIENEKKAVSGMQKLVDAYSRQHEFADRDAMEDARLEARQTHAMLNFLDASHYKLSKTLNNLDGKELPTHKFSTYMECTTDKTHLPMTYLRVPVHLIAEGFNEADFSARGKADGSYDCNGATYETLAEDNEDYFSDNDVDDEFDNYEVPEQPPSSESSPHGSRKLTKVVCSCKVLYDFTGTQTNELSVKEGDLVKILERGTDGWWKAELHGAVGLIPESYVEVLS